MKARIHLPFFTTLMLSVIVTPISAQLIADGATNTLSNVTNSFVGDVTVGTNGSFTLLVLSNNALLTNSVDGVIGRNATAKSNEVRLVSPTARWFMGNNLFVSNNGSFSRLVVSNGALVRNNTGFVGPNVPSSNNVAVVTGPGSVWSNANVFYLGFSGAGNQLIVNNGGVLRNNASTIGVNGASSNNLAVVTGSGSLWSNASSLQLGFSGAGNRLVVSNGGFVRSSVGAMGSQPSGSNTVAVVTGSGSTWSNAAELYVGNSSPSNLLLVSAGGAVRNGHGNVGANFTASNNLALITGPGSLWSNALDLNVGSFSANNRMIVSNGATVVAAGNGLIGPTANGNGNSVTVTDPGSRWRVAGNLLVGVPASFCRLLVSDGAGVEDALGFVGSGESASNNLAVVTGAGSLWTNAGELYVGNSGSGNSLLVSNGGTVFAVFNRNIGYNAGANSNTVMVTGANSRWLGDDSLYVGSAGSFNRLFVRNGAQVASGIGTLGGILGANGNQALVTDAGATWSNRFDLNVGENGSANQLVISNGGAIFSASDGFIGRQSGANSNMAIVTDAGTRWLIASNLFVGSNGPASGLVVANGGRVDNSFATLGVSLSSSNNWALISGAGSIWSNRNNLLVGGTSPGNSLVISNGAQVQCDYGALSVGLTSSNNEVLVSGVGSIWSNRNELHVGNLGRGNSLVVVSGGRVDCNHATIGVNTSASNNQAIVTDAGSFFRAQISVNIGNSSGGNRLVISNGASFFDDGVTIGLSGTNNEALATGPGTTWTNRVAITVGHLRGHNQLVISNGAFVLGGNVFVGFDPASTNNRVVMHGGTLLVNNTTGGIGALDVRRGTNVLNAGLVDANRLFVTNTLGQFEFNGGKLVANGTAVGNGATAATFSLRNGTHSFANNLVVASNAALIGNGTITGILTVQSGGTLSPGTSIGSITLSNSPVLQGATLMEISKNGAALTHDQIQVAAPLTFGGSLVVTNLGPTALAIGDRFPLFSASGFTGSFSSVTLPSLPYTLTWTNKLAVDGSVEVVAFVPPPVILTIARTNNFITLSWPTNGSDYCLETSTDLAPPVYWQPITGGVAINAANFVLTLPNNAAVAKQFFRLAFPCNTESVTLAVERTNNLVTLNWPSHAFRLETTFNLAPPVTWQTVTNGITSTGTGRTFSFTNSPGVAKQFFRLAFP